MSKQRRWVNRPDEHGGWRLAMPLRLMKKKERRVALRQLKRGQILPYDKKTLEGVLMSGKWGAFSGVAWIEAGEDWTKWVNP